MKLYWKKTPGPATLYHYHSYGEPMVHTVIYRYDVNNTKITLVKQAKKEDRLVVIDQYGGKEVGAAVFTKEPELGYCIDGPGNLGIPRD